MYSQEHRLTQRDTSRVKTAYHNRNRYSLPSQLTQQQQQQQHRCHIRDVRVSRVAPAESYCMLSSVDSSQYSYVDL